MKNINLQEIIAVLVIVALIIFTILYPTEYKDKFGTVVSVVLASYFTNLSNDNNKNKPP
jgi:hypothetical protein